MTDETQITRSFTDFFAEHRRGASLYEAGEVMRELVAAVEATGKKGSMTIKISLEPDAKYGTAVTVSDEITSKLPVHDKESSLFFMDGSHDLVRNDPRQMTIE